MTVNNELMISMQHEVAQMDLYNLYTNTLTPITKINYISTIKSFFGVQNLQDISIQDMQSITPDIVNVWAHRQLMEGNAKSTINRKLSAMHSFYEFLCRRNVGIMTYNPFSTNQGAIRFKNAIKDYSDKKALTPVETSKLLRSVNAKNRTGDDQVIAYRDLLVLQILITTGLRRAELCGIKIGDITLNQGQWTVSVLGKGNKVRLMVLAEPVKHTMDVYLKLRGVSYKDKSLPLIISHSSNADSTAHVNTSTVYRIVKRYADRAGLDVEMIAPHNLRHTFATMSYADLGVNKDSLQALMGHSSSATTTRYIHSVEMIKNSPAAAIADLCGLDE